MELEFVIVRVEGKLYLQITKQKGVKKKILHDDTIFSIKVAHAPQVASDTLFLRGSDKSSDENWARLECPVGRLH